jgi:hypothetical protein
MAAGDPITDLSDLVNLATGGGGGAPEQINFFKRPAQGGTGAATPVAGRFISLWKYDGSPSGATSNPTTAVVVTNATAGAFKQTTPASGARKRLLSIVAAGLTTGVLVIYDRLVQHGGMSGTATGAQTTNLTSSTTPALTRHTSGVGVELWLEIYTAIGGTARTVTASYTNTTPTAGQTTQATTWGGTAFAEVDRLVALPIASGDTGVTSVQSVTNSATTGTAGNFGITLAYPLVELRQPLIGSGVMWNGILTAGGPIDLGVTSDACIALGWIPTLAAIPDIFGQAFFIEK